MTSRKKLQEKIDKLELETDKQTTEALDEMVMKGLSKGITPKDSMQLSDEVCETIYSHAYNLYNRGKYSEASYIFRLLIMLDYTQAKYQMGLAACLHMEKKYEVAAQIYMLTAILNTGNPLPYYHAADCMQQQGSPASASFMLQLAINEAGDKPEYAILTERCRLMMESMSEAADEEIKKDIANLAKTKDDLQQAKADGKKAKRTAKKSKGS